MNDIHYPIKGSCQCGGVSYELLEPPLMVVACHCKECQKLSTSAFSITAMIHEDSIQFSGLMKDWSRSSDSGNISLEILVFGNDAWPIKIKELPYLKVGPYHTNTVAGLQLAMDMLRRKRNTNKQIFMITDGKPSCLRMPDGQYYKNSNGLDPFITNKCYAMAQQARRLHIPITTFMIAEDPYLMQFIREFTQANRGKAFYTGLKGLGEMIFEDYENNRKKRIKG